MTKSKYSLASTDAILDLEYAQSAVIQYFNHIYPVNHSLSEAIKGMTYLLKIGKKCKIVNLGETQKAIYFIVKGAIRSYYIDQMGNDVSSWLLYEGDLAISVFSFFSQKPSSEILETMEDCTLLVLTYEKLYEIYNTHIEFNFIGRVMTEQYYIKSEEKANELRMYSAKERYIHLIEQRPNIINRTPVRIIASYLGITRFTLSKIRSKI